MAESFPVSESYFLPELLDTTAHVHVAPIARVRPMILCIDDEPQVSEAMTRRFSEYDVDVQRAYFGTQGYWLANNEMPDVIITDYRMPQGDGGFVVETLRKNQKTKHIPIVVLSGQVDPSTRVRLRRFGVRDILRKPADFLEILATVTKYIPLHAS